MFLSKMSHDFPTLDRKIHILRYVASDLSNFTSVQLRLRQRDWCACGYGISLPAIAAALTKTMSNLRAKAKWRFGSMLLTATNNVVATTQMLKT